MAGIKAMGQMTRAQTGILPGERIGPGDVHSTTSPRQALIVTSDIAALGLCREALEGTPYVVCHADDFKASQRPRAQPVNLLIVDLSLGCQATLDLLRQIKSLYPEAVPVVLADDVSADFLLSALREGVVDCLTKPLDIELLREAVARAREVDERNSEFSLLKAFSPLFEVSNDINSSWDLDEVLSATARHAIRITKAHASHVVLLDPSNNCYVFRAGHGERERWEQEDQTILSGAVHEAISSARCLYVPDLHTGVSDECLECAERNGLRSSVWIPLLDGDRSVGAIAVCSKTTGSWPSNTVDVLRALASYAATAVERARLFQEMRRGLEKLDILYNINRAVGSSFELDEVMNTILQIESVLPYDSAAVFVLDERENVLRMQASRNLDAELQATTNFKMGEGIVGWVAAQAESLSVPDTSLDVRYEPRGTIDNPRSILAVPLRAGGKVLAVLNLTRYRVNAFTEEEARLAELIASQAAQAMRNAQLYQNACQLLQEESALYSLANIISGSSSTEELLNKVAPLVVETLRAESCIVCLINPATNHLFLARSIGVPGTSLRWIVETVDDWAVHRQALSSQEPAARIIRRTNAPQQRESLLLGSWKGLVSVLSAPLIIRQRTLGVITVARRAVYGVYAHSDKDLLMNMASQMAVAIEELRLRVHDMLTLYELSQFSGTTLDLEEIYKRILSKVEPLFDCEGLCLLLFDTASERFELKCSLGASVDFWSILEQLPFNSLAGHWPDTHQPLAFSVSEDANELAPWTAGCGGTPVVVAPMVVEGSLIGALALRFRGDDLPSEDRRILLASLAVQTALVIRNATLYAASQELAIAEERNRIAREFHDGVTQNLAHLMLKMQLITRLLDMDQDRAKAELERSRQVLEESVKELRRCIYALRPVHLEGTGLSQALERIASEFAEQNELEVFLDLDPISKLPSRIEAAVFRVVQEALNNVRKHAQANHFAIQLKLKENYLHLTIEDDGVGFDSDADPAGRSEHFGVPQMKERAGELGGYLVIKSSPGEGTTIEAWIPLGGRGKLGLTG